MTEDDENIQRALHKQRLGLALDAQDRWCLQAHERRERNETRAQPLDTGLVNDTPAAFDADGILTEELADTLGYALAQVTDELRQEFQSDLNALRDQLRVTRSLVDNDRANTVVDLPKMNWHKSNAA